MVDVWLFARAPRQVLLGFLKEVVGRKLNPGFARLLQQGVLMLRGHDTTSSAPFLRVGPAMNIAHVDAGHGRYSLGAAALANDVGGCVAHADDIAIFASHLQAENANIAPDTNCVLRNNHRMRNELIIDWIRKGLAASKLRQKDLAPAFGGDPTKVSKILKGERSLKAHEIGPVAAILRMPPPLEAIPGPTDPNLISEADRKIDAVKARIADHQWAAVAVLLEMMFPPQSQATQEGQPQQPVQPQTDD